MVLIWGSCFIIMSIVTVSCSLGNLNVRLVFFPYFFPKLYGFSINMKKKIKAKIDSHSTKYMTQILYLKKYQGCKEKKKITDCFGED